MVVRRVIKAKLMRVVTQKVILARKKAKIKIQKNQKMNLTNLSLVIKVVFRMLKTAKIKVKSYKYHNQYSRQRKSSIYQFQVDFKYVFLTLHSTSSIILRIKILLKKYADYEREQKFSTTRKELLNAQSRFQTLTIFSLVKQINQGTFQSSISIKLLLMNRYIHLIKIKNISLDCGISSLKYYNLKNSMLIYWQKKKYTIRRKRRSKRHSL